MTELAAATRPATEHRVLTIATVLLSCFVAQSFARFSFGLLLPAMKADLGVSYGLAGWLGTINLAGYLVGTIATSFASLRVPSHRLMQFGVVLSTIGISVLAATRSTPLLLVGMALGGLGGAATWIPAPAISASAFPPEKRGFAMGFTSAGIGTGIVLVTIGTTVARNVLDKPGLWRPIWLTEAIVGVIVSALSFFVLKPVPLTPGSPPKISVLRQVPGWWAPTSAYACFGLGYVLFATFVVAALEQDAGFARGHASQVFALMGAGNAVGALTVGKISDRIGRRTTMIASFSAAGIGCFAVLIGAEPFVSLATFGYGIGMSGAVVSIASHLGDHVRPQEFSAAFGVVTASFAVTQTVGPRLGGWMADHQGNFSAVFVLAGVLWGVGALLASGLPRTVRSP